MTTRSKLLDKSAAHTEVLTNLGIFIVGLVMFDILLIAKFLGDKIMKKFLPRAFFLIYFLNEFLVLLDVVKG